MSKLSARDRREMADSDYGLPHERKYPLLDRAHAANAKARATQQFEAGNLTSGQRAQIDTRADKKLKSR